MVVASETLLGLTDAADVLGLSTGRLRQLIDDGRLPAVKVSHTWVVKESDMLSLAQRIRAPGRPRLYELIMDHNNAHIGVRGGRLVGFCGSRASAGFVHGAGETQQLDRAKLCRECSALAPRYVVRYWRSRGLA